MIDNPSLDREAPMSLEVSEAPRLIVVLVREKKRRGREVWSESKEELRDAES